jgi:hypothetical protein
MSRSYSEETSNQSLIRVNPDSRANDSIITEKEEAMIEQRTLAH